MPHVCQRPPTLLLMGSPHPRFTVTAWAAACQPGAKPAPSGAGGRPQVLLPYLHLLQGAPQGQLDQGAPQGPGDHLGQPGLVDLSRPEKERSPVKHSSTIGAPQHHAVPSERGRDPHQSPDGFQRGTPRGAPLAMNRCV